MISIILDAHYTRQKNRQSGIQLHNLDTFQTRIYLSTPLETWNCKKSLGHPKKFRTSLKNYQTNRKLGSLVNRQHIRKLFSLSENYTGHQKVSKWSLAFPDYPGTYHTISKYSNAITRDTFLTHKWRKMGAAKKWFTRHRRMKINRVGKRLLLSS